MVASLTCLEIRFSWTICSISRRNDDRLRDGCVYAWLHPSDPLSVASEIHFVLSESNIRKGQKIQTRKLHQKLTKFLRRSAFPTLSLSVMTKKQKDTPNKKKPFCRCFLLFLFLLFPSLFSCCNGCCCGCYIGFTPKTPRSKTPLCTDFKFQECFQSNRRFLKGHPNFQNC